MKPEAWVGAASDRQLVQIKAGHARLAADHRAAQAEAVAHGDKSTATTLGMLAAHLEQGAALADAELRARAVRASEAKARQQKKEAASKRRPSRRNPVKDRITDMMLVEKAAGTTFKTLLQRWEREPLDGLRLAETEPGRYTVEDENAEGVFGHYVTATLQKLYSPKK